MKLVEFWDINTTNIFMLLFFYLWHVFFLVLKFLVKICPSVGIEAKPPYFEDFIIFIYT